MKNNSDVLNCHHINSNTFSSFSGADEGYLALFPFFVIRSSIPQTCFLSLFLYHFLFSCCLFTLLSLSLFAPILISAHSIVGSADPTHAHRLNEILCACARVTCACSSVSMIVSVLLIHCTIKMWAFVCACGGGVVYFIMPASSIFPNAISSMWKAQAGCSSFYTPFLVFNKSFFRTARLLALWLFLFCHAFIFSLSHRAQSSTCARTHTLKCHTFVAFVKQICLRCTVTMCIIACCLNASL